MGETFGIVGALAAFPLRLAVCEVDRQSGDLRSSVTRQATHVVFGRKLLACATEAEIERRVVRERKADRQLLSENGFLRILGLRPVPEASAITRASLLAQARLSERDLDLLSLFDAFEHDSEPYSFRDLIMSKKYAALIDGGASWGAIARSIHRSSGAVTSLTSLSLGADGRHTIHSRLGEQLSDLDGPMFLPAGRSNDTELARLFAEAEDAAVEKRFDDAAALYERYLSIDPSDADAAYNLGNCLVAADRPDQARRSFLVALKLDTDFVEAWYNLANLLKAQGQTDAARRHLERAIEIDGDYADAIYNLATLEFEAGRLAEAQRLWARYLELDSHSEWAQSAARGVRYVDMQLTQRHAG